MHREAIRMRRKKLLDRLAGVIACPIMDEKQMLLGLCQDHLQEALITVRGKPALNTLREQAPREILNGAKDLIAFAFAAGGYLGLLSPTRPGITQRAPLGKAGLIFKKNQTVAARGGPQNRGPFLLEPGLTAHDIQMIRDKTGLLKRKA